MMLKNTVAKELAKLDILGTLHKLTISATEHLQQEEKQTCLVELKKILEYVETLQEIANTVKILEMEGKNK